MKKYITILLIFLSIFGLISIVIITFQNPLRKSEENIKNDLLKQMPLGIDMHDVMKIVNKKNTWNIIWVSEKHGIVIGRNGPSTVRILDDEINVGKKSMCVDMGYYYKYFFVQTDVSAFFAFDENSKLIEIAVSKSMNVL